MIVMNQLMEKHENDRRKVYGNLLESHHQSVNPSANIPFIISHRFTYKTVVISREQ